MKFPGESLEKLQLPFGPGNKQLMAKIPFIKDIGKGGDPLEIETMFEAPKAAEVLPADPLVSASPERDKKEAAFRTRLRKARVASLEDDAPISTTLG